jgi:hypothetical protein
MSKLWNINGKEFVEKRIFARRFGFYIMKSVILRSASNKAFLVQNIYHCPNIYIVASVESA